MFAIMTHVLLVSPTNRLYIVSRDKTAVKEHCQTNGIRYGYNMNEMCGLHDADSCGGHKQHVENWVLAERMQFIQENNDTTMHPIIGGNAAFYIDSDAVNNPNMSGFKPARLNELLNSKRRLTARSRFPGRDFNWGTAGARI